MVGGESSHCNRASGVEINLGAEPRFRRFRRRDVETVESGTEDAASPARGGAFLRSPYLRRVGPPQGCSHGSVDKVRPQPLIPGLTSRKPISRYNSLKKDPANGKHRINLVVRAVVERVEVGQNRPTHRGW
jgi:hypothetical protein